jgi:hypothetical protein
MTPNLTDNISIKEIWLLTHNLPLRVLNLTNMYIADIYQWNQKPNKFYFTIFSGKTLSQFSKLKYKKLIIFSQFLLQITFVFDWVYTKDLNLLDGLMTTEDNWISNNISFQDILKEEKITLTFKNLLNWP